MQDSTNEKIAQDLYSDYNNDLNVSQQQKSTKNFERLDDLSRTLTSKDVYQALCTLNNKPKSFQKRTMPFNDQITTMIFEQEYDCCRLLRSDDSSRLILPLARRGRSTFSTRSHRLLCSNCTKIKQRQINILKTYHKLKHPTNHVFQVTINLDLSPKERMAFNNNEYGSSQTVTWNMNKSDGHIMNVSYNTDLLNENEKNTLVDETIEKLQTILHNRSAPVERQDLETTRQLLQKTIDILSSTRQPI